MRNEKFTNPEMKQKFKDSEVFNSGTLRSEPAVMNLTSNEVI
jgi:hypothetical protein